MNQKGSASMLVMMVSLTLMIFGVFAMMNAYSGLAVARRHGEWNAINHGMESRAAQVAARVHQLVEDALLDIGPMEMEDEWEKAPGQVADRVVESIEAERLPVDLRGLTLEGNAREFHIIVGIQLDPIPEQRVGFMGEIIYHIFMDEASPVVKGTVREWKSVAESFEYIEGLEFKDVEVEWDID